MSRPPSLGEPAPWFEAPSPTNPHFHFDTIAGRYVVLFFFGSAAREEGARALAAFHKLTDIFDDTHAIFFGVSNDASDQTEARIANVVPGFRYFFDFQAKIATLYGVATRAETIEPQLVIRPCAFVLSPMLQILAIVPMQEAEAFVSQIASFLRALPLIPPSERARPPAPVLVVPHILPRDFCRELIDLYERKGGFESGFMREIDGKTVGLIDNSHKKRFDCEIEDDAQRRMLDRSIVHRLVPMIERVFQFHATRIERYIVSCYDSQQGGYFRPHRDNTTAGTAHRRFAVTINLNAEEFEGGELRFPEFGRQTYRAPTGGAVVFSCSMLHEATPVTKGRRYACLPFLYDDAAAQVREANRKFIQADGAIGAQAPSPFTQSG